MMMSKEKKGRINRDNNKANNNMNNKTNNKKRKQERYPCGNSNKK